MKNIKGGGGGLDLELLQWDGSELVELVRVD